MTIAYSGDSITFPDNSVQNTAATGFGFKNRIINGAMVIDQRNAGASVTPTNGQYTLDRWFFTLTQSSKLTCQQSTVAPTGFANSNLLTSSSAYSVLSGDTFMFRQYIEGLNVADLGWGTASAQTVTLLFWVRSSLTGTFGGAICNGAGNRSYPYSYTVSSANTWEQKSVTITGDTTGTWATGNTAGLDVRFSLGSGATFSGTAGAWAAGNLAQPTGATSVVGTSGATFYITGVQLEKGSTATSFDYRPYGTELALCQRYLPATFNRVGNDPIAVVQCLSNVLGLATIPFSVTPRVNPTGITTTTVSNFYVTNPTALAGFNASAMTFELASNLVGQIRVAFPANGATAGLIVGLLSNSSGAQILWTGCEL